LPILPMPDAILCAACWMQLGSLLNYELQGWCRDGWRDGGMEGWCRDGDLYLRCN
jgi:hypothetical protein